MKGLASHADGASRHLQARERIDKKQEEHRVAPSLEREKDQHRDTATFEAKISTFTSISITRHSQEVHPILPMVALFFFVLTVGCLLGACLADPGIIPRREAAFAWGHPWVFLNHVQMFLRWTLKIHVCVSGQCVGPRKIILCGLGGK